MFRRHNAFIMGKFAKLTLKTIADRTLCFTVKMCICWSNKLWYRKCTVWSTERSKKQSSVYCKSKSKRHESTCSVASYTSAASRRPIWEWNKFQCIWAGTIYTGGCSLLISKSEQYTARYTFGATSSPVAFTMLRNTTWWFVVLNSMKMIMTNQIIIYITTNVTAHRTGLRRLSGISD